MKKMQNEILVLKETINQDSCGWYTQCDKMIKLINYFQGKGINDITYKYDDSNYDPYYPSIFIKDVEIEVGRDDDDYYVLDKEISFNEISYI